MVGAGVLVRPSDAIQVMLVNGDPHPASIEDELHYATRALRLSADTHGALGLRAVDASALAKYDLTQVDVLVLANAEAPEPAVAERITRFVQQGGGVIIAAGDHVQALANYQRSLSLNRFQPEVAARVAQLQGAVGAPVSAAPPTEAPRTANGRHAPSCTPSACAWLSEK